MLWRKLKLKGWVRSSGGGESVLNRWSVKALLKKNISATISGYEDISNVYEGSRQKE